MTDPSANDADRRFGRRSTLLGLGGLALGGIASGPTVLGDEDEGATGQYDDERSGASPQRFLSRLRTEAFVVDMDGSGSLTTETQLVGDPSGERRDAAVHVTSRGESSRDYVAAGIDLRADSLTLADVSGDAAIAYDYYKDAETTHRVPDDAFLFLQTGPTTFAVAVRGADAERSGTWETRAVSSELTEDGWRAIEVDTGELDLGNLQRQLAGSGVEIGDIGGLIAMVSGGIESVSDLAHRFGGDAAVLGLGIGTGALDGAVTEAYYNGLEVAGERRPLPAALAVDPSFSAPHGRSDGRFTASFSLATNEQIVSASDIDPDSVRLAPYSPVSPPIPGSPWADTAATADGVDVSDGTVRAEFVPGQVRRSLQGDRSRPLVVYGDFDVPEPYTFVGVGHR
ncbi:hypothetical protein C477_21135 [Haloterrigena salina JCM 13891]|uniref:Uncharacterized protein n=1 Tax=Haloterrigena salina JCM 13891 TaxID=1227488 RepID=M0BT02_9EURY|nr:hypothetical protein [Haloterrigena salina]ELZ14065.1 hypothetical protein C477_21135 [Haloterrigena salina JCM 13891]